MQIDILLEKLDEYLVPAVAKMESIIDIAGTDWREYRPKEKERIGQSAQLAKTIKTVLDTSILREDGSLDPESEKKWKDGTEFLNQFAS